MPEQRKFDANQIKNFITLSHRLDKLQDTLHSKVMRALYFFLGKNSPTYKVSRRIRCGPTTAAEFRTSLRKLLRRPNTRREAWVVISGAISRQALKHELENPGQSPQLLQVFNLIVSLYTQAKSLGIDPKVFCNP